MKTIYLLDVNLLIALCDPMHVHHDGAHRWFASKGRGQWATCPLTENSFVRIASHPRYPNRPGDVSVVLSILQRFCQTKGHSFWPEDISLRDLLPADAVIHHAQITDLYLLGLAAHKGGKLATLDRRIPADVIPGGIEALELLFVESSI
ncbi:MAG: TA system VapC family ribonuclease toxin [Thermodesulfobacteriota bacterium]